MSLIETVQAVVEEQMQQIAETIESELKAECPVGKTGIAKASIHIEKKGDTTYRIGSTDEHLFFADQGNRQSTQIIYPKRAKALKFTDGSFHGSAKTYYYPDRQGFVKRIADRHR